MSESRESAVSERGLTAKEIESQEFKKAFRGCDPEEVQYYLRSVAAEFERLKLDNGRLLEENGSLKRDLESLKTREKTLQDTLVSAQRMAEELKEKARGEADLILQKARLDGDEIVKAAQDRLTLLESDISRSSMERETLERRLQSVIEQHLAMLEMRRGARMEADNVHPMPPRESRPARQISDAR